MKKELPSNVPVTPACLKKSKVYSEYKDVSSEHILLILTFILKIEAAHSSVMLAIQLTAT